MNGTEKKMNGTEKKKKLKNEWNKMNGQKKKLMNGTENFVHLHCLQFRECILIA